METHYCIRLDQFPNRFTETEDIDDLPWNVDKDVRQKDYVSRKGQRNRARS